MNSYVTRAATSHDIDTICRHREEMFREMGISEAVLPGMTAAFREWLAPRLADGRYIGWMVDCGGAVIAGAGLIILDWPPHPRHPSDCRRGYLLNVYVDEPHRGRGLATMLAKTATDETRARGIAFMTLHASDAGRPVYEKLGWTAMPEMGLPL